MEKDAGREEMKGDEVHILPLSCPVGSLKSFPQKCSNPLFIYIYQNRNLKHNSEEVNSLIYLHDIPLGFSWSRGQKCKIWLHLK